MSCDLIITDGPSGKCPVQAEGTINGHEFYFRSRGGRWALAVAGPSGDVFGEDRWYHHEEYNGRNRGEPVPMRGHMVQFGAGWADEDECREFIAKAAKLYAEAHP